jgi:predicted nucleic acid-binding protein
MPSDVVVDVSVVVAAISPAEPRYAESLGFIQAVHERRLTLEVPAHFILELYAVTNRTPRKLQELGFMTEQNPIALRLKSIGEPEVQAVLAWVSSVFPGKSPTRGADLAYVWVARESGLPLVTLDNGLHQFREAGLQVYYPGELLAKWTAAG